MIKIIIKLKRFSSVSAYKILDSVDSSTMSLFMIELWHFPEFGPYCFQKPRLAGVQITF